MSREGLRIDTGLVTNTANQIAEQNAELYQTLRRIGGLMERTETQWDSPAARELRTDFDRAAAKFFESYRVTIEDYVRFLRVTVVDSYAHLDEQLKTNAQRFTSS